GTLYRLPDEPDDLEPVMIFGILAFATAIAVHLLTLWVLRRGAHVDTSLSQAETLRVMDEVLRGEPAASARLRRVTFAESVRVLLARGTIGVVEARELLRVYTR